MIDYATFIRIRRRYGHYASWAVWADESNKPKEHIGELGIFEITEHGDLLKQLNPNTVLVGLNISRRVQFPFGNFHDGRPNSMDYKIRYALKETVLWGAYMTDIIKDFEQKASGKMMNYLRNNKGFERENLEIFQTELSDLRVVRPTLIAFGRDAFQILDRNLGHTYNILRGPHYSNYGSKETYREEIAAIIKLKTNLLTAGAEPRRCRARLNCACCPDSVPPCCPSKRLSDDKAEWRRAGADCLTPLQRSTGIPWPRPIAPEAVLLHFLALTDHDGPGS